MCEVGASDFNRHFLVAWLPLLTDDRGARLVALLFRPIAWVPHE